MKSRALFLVSLLLLGAGAASFGAETSPVDALTQEFQGLTAPVQRGDAQLQAAYGQVLAALLPKLGDAEKPADGATAQTFLNICFRASRPGAERERAALCKAIVPLLAESTPNAARQILLMQLERIGGAECTAAVTGLLADKDPYLRARALRVLQTDPDPAAIEALRKGMDAADTPAARIAFLNALAYRRDAASVPAIARFLADGDAALAAAAVDGLGRIGTLEAAQALAKAKPADALKGAVASSRARCAEALAAAGNTAEAERIYAALAGDRQPVRSRILGLHGLVAVRSKKALATVLDCLAERDPKLQRAAASECAYVQDPQAATRIAGAYRKLPVPVQAVVVASLATRGEAAFLPVALQALKSQDAALRLAGIRAAGKLGGAEVVPVLAEVAAASTDRGEKQAVHDALMWLRAEGVDPAILKLVQTGKPEVRAELMSVLVDRKSPEAVALLMAGARGTDAKAATEALKSLARIAGAGQYPELVKLLVETKEESVRVATGDTLAAMAKRLGQPDDSAAPLVAALSGAGTEAKLALLETLAQVGGDSALSAVTRATADTDTEVKRAAVAALAESWEDSKPAPTLLRLAKEEGDKALKVQALRGYLRLLGLDAKSRPQETVQQLAEALPLAQRVEEKKLVLSVLVNCRTPAAVALAKKCGEDPALVAEVASTVTALLAPPAQPKPAAGGRRPAGGGTPVFKPAPPTIDTLAAPWAGRDVGPIGASGAVTVNQGVFTVKASGTDIQSTADGMHFVYQTLSGNCSIVARVASLQAVNPWTKAGVMIREALDAGASNAYVCVTPENNASWQMRNGAGVKTDYQKTGQGVVAPYWVKLTRAGDTLTGFISADGKAWKQIATGQVKMKAEVLVGLAVTSHAPTTLAEAVVDHVTVGK